MLERYHPTELSDTEKTRLLAATRDSVLPSGEAVCIEAQRLKITAYTHGLTEGAQARMSIARQWWLRGIFMGIVTAAIGLFPAVYILLRSYGY